MDAEQRRHSRVGLTGLPDDARKAMLAFTGMLLGVAFLVLVIASVNVGAMLGACGRASSRIGDSRRAGCCARAARSAVVDGESRVVRTRCDWRP